MGSRHALLEAPAPDAVDVSDDTDDEAMSPEFAARFAAAKRRGDRTLRETPHAASVRFDPGPRELVIRLTSGSGVMVPVAQLDALKDATDDELAGVHLGPLGGSLTWPAIDAHISVAGIVRYIFGRQALARAAATAFGATGGRSTSDAKIAAAKANGAKGGRPRKDGRPSKDARHGRRASNPSEIARQELQEKIEAAKQQYRAVAGS